MSCHWSYSESVVLRLVQSRCVWKDKQRTHTYIMPSIFNTAFILDNIMLEMEHISLWSIPSLWLIVDKVTRSIVTLSHYIWYRAMRLYTCQRRDLQRLQKQGETGIRVEHILKPNKEFQWSRNGSKTCMILISWLQYKTKHLATMTPLYLSDWP